MTPGAASAGPSAARAAPRPRASSLRIVWNDWVALFCAMSVPGVWAVHLAFPHLRRGASSPPALATTLSALALAVLAWRVARVRALFASGRRAHGVVLALRAARDRGRLEYAFPVQGTTVESWCPVHRTKDVLALEAGTPVEILYDPADPRRAVPVALFAKR